MKILLRIKSTCMRDWKNSSEITLLPSTDSCFCIYSFRYIILHIGCHTFPLYRIAGGSRLGLRRDGSRSPLPVDVHDSFNSRNLHDPVRSTGALRRHETDRHGILFRCSTAIPSIRSGAAEDHRIIDASVRARARCVSNVLSTWKGKWRTVFPNIAKLW